MSRFSRVRAILSLFAVAASASAGTITWTVINGAFEDGGTLTGSFAYDAATNVFSSIDLTAAGGTILPGAHYTAINPCCGSALPNASFLFFVTADGLATGATVLEAILQPGFSMTDAGGTIPFLAGGAAEGTCPDASCIAADVPLRSLTGSITAEAAVPEPGTFTLLLPIAGFLLWRRRR